MNDVDVDDVAEALYSLPPEQFTAARDRAASEATDADARKAIKALRKPTTSAFAVNIAVRDHPDLADELLALAEELRTAMSGQGGDLRALTERRRELISSLVDADLPANVRDDVTATFEAATADLQLGAAVRSGRLVKPLRYAGFGELPDLSDAMATPLRVVKPAKQPASKPAKKSAVNRPAKEAPPPKKSGPDPVELDAARQRVLDLSGLADDAQRRYDAASRAAGQARIALEQAEKERAEAHKAAREAHAEAERARRDLGRLERS